MNDHDDKNVMLYMLAGFGLGAIVGAAAGLLFAPKAGTETREELTEKIKETFLEVSRNNKKMGTITLSINPFIPKPTTPFQWCAMDTPSAFRKKVAIIRDGLKKVSNLIINTESSKTATINAILSRGDRRMASVIEAASEQGWAVALKSSNALTETEPQYLLKKRDNSLKALKNIIYSNISPDAPLPWDILDTGIKKEFLIKELKRAQDEKISPDCPMVECSKCGICREAPL